MYPYLMTILKIHSAIVQLDQKVVFLYYFYDLFQIIINIFFKGDCKHVAALLYLWKYKGYSKDIKTNVKSTPPKTERHLYPGPFSSTLTDSHKVNKPSPIHHKEHKRRNSRSPSKKILSDTPKLKIIGFNDSFETKDETERLKLENKSLRS